MGEELDGSEVLQRQVPQPQIAVGQMTSCRHLVFVLGDQLDESSAALADFDTVQDRVLMAKVREESTHVWSTKSRTAFFFSAMRHFAEALRAKKFVVDYQCIGTHEFSTLADALADAIERHRPQKVLLVEPGDWRVEQALTTFALKTSANLVIREDKHFMCSRKDFAEWARGYKQMRLEYFYRMMRKRYNVMMEGDQPLQGRWNFDAENRGAFPKGGPANVPARVKVLPDAITCGAIADVEKHFPDHPGTLAEFAWPVTRAEALHSLKLFAKERLPRFGEFQDAMWTGEPFLYHAHISAALNMKLLNPREVINAALTALNEGRAPIEAVEGFVRQVIGWREFMRGLYWLDMPGMREANHFGHERKLPEWYWTADTQMNCMRQTIRQTLDHGYAHHIQRLMITGIFGLLAETQPQQLEDWYLAVYIDAVEWVELPNVAGMALFANNGRFTSKPYIASGQYIKRMSNYCQGCQYKPELKTGNNACPVTTLYWNFLDKHEKMLTGNPRTALMVKNIARLSDEERAAIRAQAAGTLKNLDSV
ncbi:MAG: cryptochrome/photolyase family protein [Usitatibacteraceae bacterium]